MRIAIALVVSCLPLIAACGSSSDPGQTGSNPNQLTFSTGKFEIGPGDNFECFYTKTYTQKELSVASASGHQGVGGHHVLVYYTDTPRDPQHHPCTDSEMLSWHQIAGSGGDSAETLGLPDGFALKVPEGKQLVLQSHYINTTSNNRTVNDSVTLNLVNPSQVRNYVNFLVTDDESFEIPPMAPIESVTECTLERDFDMILALPHMHQWGRKFKLETLDASGNPANAILRNDTWDPSFTGHPPISYYTEETPLHLTKGTTLRQTCSWQNDTPDPIVFPREMCLAFFYYFPGTTDFDCHMVKKP